MRNFNTLYTWCIYSQTSFAFSKHAKATQKKEKKKLKNLPSLFVTNLTRGVPSPTLCCDDPVPCASFVLVNPSGWFVPMYEYMIVAETDGSKRRKIGEIIPRLTYRNRWGPGIFVHSALELFPRESEAVHEVTEQQSNLRGTKEKQIILMSGRDHQDVLYPISIWQQVRPRWSILVNIWWIPVPLMQPQISNRLAVISTDLANVLTSYQQRRNSTWWGGR